MPYVWKIFHKNEWHLRLVAHIFTKRSLILLHFLGISIHYWRPFMSEVLYLHQTFTDYVSNQYTHYNMWNVRCNNKLRKILSFNWVLWRFQCLIQYSSNYQTFINFVEVNKIISTCHLAICNCILWIYVAHKSNPM